jgi:quinolinate synthase
LTCPARASSAEAMIDRSEIVKEIEKLKKETGAIILAHNYQPGEIQDIADYLGDSLELSRKAATTDCEVIVFCGVHFMAETAAILSPEKTVLIPRLDAGCPMANMADPQGLKRLMALHPEAEVVCYVNSTAAVKAMSHISCTSANASDVVASLPSDKEVIFVPDRHLGSHVESMTGRELICWPGYCPVHTSIASADIERARKQFPSAEVWAHPECPAEVRNTVDRVLSTGQMVKRARETKAGAVVVATEIGMLYRLRKERPDVAFVPATEQAVCPDMKLIRLEHVRDALKNRQHVVSVPEEIRAKAVVAVERMLAVDPLPASPCEGEGKRMKSVKGDR